MTQKININLDKLRSIVEVIDEGILVNILMERIVLLEINLRIKKLRAPY